MESKISRMCHMFILKFSQKINKSQPLGNFLVAKNVRVSLGR